MKAYISNWTGAQTVRVSCSEAKDTIPALVGVHCHEGPLSFAFSMTVAQAWLMANALIQAANQIDNTAATWAAKQRGEAA